jgi:hypothetical protein
MLLRSIYNYNIQSHFFATPHSPSWKLKPPFWPPNPYIFFRCSTTAYILTSTSPKSFPRFQIQHYSLLLVHQAVRPSTTILLSLATLSMPWRHNLRAMAAVSHADARLTSKGPRPLVAIVDVHPPSRGCSPHYNVRLEISRKNIENFNTTGD